jgi:uncharacterized phage protein gp47/JayE
MTLIDLKNRIYSSFVASFTNAITPLRKSFFEVISNAMASVSNLLYLYLDNVQKNSFLNSCSQSRVLSYFAPLNRLTIKAATYAEGVIRFTGLPGTTIPLGTKVIYNNTSLEYETTVASTIDINGYVDITMKATSDNLGSQANTLPNIDLTLSVPILGINSAVVSTLGFTKGIDKETVESLRQRCMIKQGDSPLIGNRNYYRTLGNKISNVKATFISELVNGPGTFGITILTYSNNGVAIQQDIDDVEDYFTSLSSIPAYVKADYFLPTIIYTNIQILLAVNNDTNKAIVESLARDYIYLYQRQGGTFSFLGLSKILQNQGARLIDPEHSYEIDIALTEVLDIGTITWL